MEWRIYLDRSHSSMIELTEWLDGLGEVDRELVEEDIEDLLEKAALGRIPKPVYQSLVRVGIEPMLLELHWSFKGLGRRRNDVALRQYHVEPIAHPDTLVALHRHIKRWAGLTGAQTKDLQETEMRFATFRYLAGKQSEWK